MSLVLNKLNPEDIDEKIYLNHKDGIEIHKLLELIKEEYKDFRWAEIRAAVQCQFYLEQIEHLEKRIKEIAGKENPYAKDDFKQKLIYT